MNGSTTSVSTELALWLVAPGPKAVPLVANLHYTATDPYAIRMAFNVGVDEPVEWIFGRELLAAGATDAVGKGDIQIWPADEETLSIALCSPHGSALFEAPLVDFIEFLQRTYEIAAPGREPEFMDIDAELDRILWEV